MPGLLGYIQSRLVLTPVARLDAVDAANALSPSPLPSHTLPRGTPGAGSDAVHMIKYDASKARKLLGLAKYISIAEATKDTLADFAQRGW